MAKSFLRRCIIVGLLLFQLLLKASAALNLSLEYSPLLLGLLLELGQVVCMGLSHCIFIEPSHHFVVVPLRWVQQGLHVRELQQDLLHLFVAIVDDFRSYQCDIGFIQQEPIGVLALEDLEVFVEEGSISLKLFLTCDLALAIVGCINQVIEQVLLAYLWLILP